MTWQGIFKLVEETGELNQILGKLGEYPDGQHPDQLPDGGPTLRARVVTKIGDVYAALDHFVEKNMNSVEISFVEAQRLMKVKKFRWWELSGLQEHGKE